MGWRKASMFSRPDFPTAKATTGSVWYLVHVHSGKIQDMMSCKFEGLGCRAKPRVSFELSLEAVAWECAAGSTTKQLCWRASDFFALPTTSQPKPRSFLDLLVCCSFFSLSSTITKQQPYYQSS